MRWGTGPLRWVRPLHSILCILSDEAGAQVVPLTVDRVVRGAGAIRATGSGDLGDVAAVLGYADQPHFSRDFSAVTGMTPRAFAALHTR